jgi:RsiW-degrading membrane proteinase PrsW (M82 family)
MSNQWMPPPPPPPPGYPGGPPPGYPGMPYPGAPLPPPKGGGVGFVLQMLGLGCGGLALFGVAALLLLIFVAELGPGIFVVAVLMAFIPAVFYLSIVLLIDRYDPEPPWVLALAFLWGAVISIFGALIINDTTSIIAASAAGEQAGNIVGAVISAPLAEEGMKGLGLLILLLALRKEFDGVVDGIVYACVIALGFATVENVLYYGRALGTAGLPGGTVTFVLRGLMSPFAHPLFTSMTGIGLGIAREQKRGFFVWAAPVMGYLVAVLLHATWNGVATFASGGGPEVFFGVYLLGWLPAFLCFLVAIGFCLFRERKLIRQYLYDEVAIGVLSPQEYLEVTSLRKRTAFHWRGFSRNGIGGYRTAKAFSRAATKLALSKWHTLKAAEKNAETRSLGQIPVHRQELAARRAALG